MFAEKRSNRLYVHYLLDHLKSNVWKNFREHHQLNLFLVFLLTRLALYFLSTSTFDRNPAPRIVGSCPSVFPRKYFQCIFFYTNMVTIVGVFWIHVLSPLSQCQLAFLCSEKLNDTSFYAMENHNGIWICFLSTVMWRLFIWLKLRQVLTFYHNHFSFVTLT